MFIEDLELPGKKYKSRHEVFKDAQEHLITPEEKLDIIENLYPYRKIEEVLTDSQHRNVDSTLCLPPFT